MSFWTLWDSFKEKFLSPARVRTTVPAFLGALVTFLLNRWGFDLTGYAVDFITEFGITLSPEAVLMFTSTGITYIVYSVVTEIEKRRPNAGLLLGRRGAPVYDVEIIPEERILPEETVDVYNQV